jgi:hypothetical protein
MNVMRDAYIAIGLVVIVAGIASLVYVTQADACAGADEARTCFIKESEVIAKRDVNEALRYVWDSVAESSDYKTAHMALHFVGAEAYRDAGSVEKAFEFLAPYTKNGNDLFSGGFQHGVFQEYFRQNNSRSIPELTHDVCGSYDAVASDPGPRAAECYHTVGHAITIVNDNAIEPSLTECDAFPREWNREWCYHGVFMENFYLRYTYYRGETAAPDVHTSFTALCKELPKRYTKQCVDFVGWIHLTDHEKDFAGAFAACAEFSESEARTCVARVARLFVVDAHKDDFGEIHATCTEAHPYANECLIGAAIGLSQGIGVIRYEAGKELCGTLSGDVRSACAYAVEHWRESLAQTVASEI